MVQFGHMYVLLYPKGPLQIDDIVCDGKACPV